MENLKFYYDYDINNLNDLDFYEKKIEFIEKKLEISLSNEYQELINSNGGILCKNKYFYKDIYGKPLCNRIIIIYGGYRIEKLVVDGEFDNYILIGESSNITSGETFYPLEYLTMDLSDGSVCIYDQSTNHPIAKSFNEFVNNIVYD